MRTLAELLQVLTSPTASQRERFDAEAELRPQIAWLPRWVAKKFPELGNAAACAGMLEEVIERARRSSRPFVGARGDGSARQWVLQTARRLAIDAQRKRRRMERRAGEMEQQERIRAEEGERTEGVRALCHRVMEALKDRLNRTRTVDEVQAFVRAMDLTLVKVWKGTLDLERLEELGYVPSGETDPNVLRRAQARLHQHRRRGRVALAELLGEMVREGALEDASAKGFAAANRLPWPPPSWGRGRVRVRRRAPRVARLEASAPSSASSAPSAQRCSRQNPSRGEMAPAVRQGGPCRARA